MLEFRFKLLLHLFHHYFIYLNTLYPYFTIRFRMTNNYVKKVLNNKWGMFTQACHINLSLWSWLENRNSVKLTMFLLQSAIVAKTWIECEFVAKALILSMRLSRKPELSIKLSWKPLCYKCSFWLWKRNNPARRAGEKNYLALISFEKKSRPGPKTQAPPPWISNGPCLTIRNCPHILRKRKTWSIWAIGVAVPMLCSTGCDIPTSEFSYVLPITSNIFYEILETTQTRNIWMSIFLLWKHLLQIMICNELRHI